MAPASLRRMNRAFSLLGIGLLVVGGLAACGGGDDDDSGGKADKDVTGDVTKVDGTKADVEVLDNSFNDENIEVKPGTKVIWTNDGQQDHDIVPVKGKAFGVEAGDFEAGDIYSYTFNKPGTYRYFCSLHGSADGGMTGAVIVK